MNDSEKTECDPADPRYGKLAAALRDLDQAHVFVPPTVDTAVLEEARSHLHPPRQGWYSWPEWAGPLKAAACFLTAALLSWLLFLRPADLAMVVGKEDLDGNGKVDIVDAFLLARRLQAGAQQDPGLDINGDGQVNLRDIDAIAATAVALENKS